jgi:hypothetical protein
MYFFKVGPVELTDGTGLLSGIIDLFEEGVALGKGVLEVTGSDVAAFCDDLIKDSRTYADIYQESVDQEGNKTMKKVTDKKSKRGISGPEKAIEVKGLRKSFKDTEVLKRRF